MNETSSVILAVAAGLFVALVGPLLVGPYMDLLDEVDRRLKERKFRKRMDEYEKSKRQEHVNPPRP